MPSFIMNPRLWPAGIEDGAAASAGKPSGTVRLPSKLCRPSKLPRAGVGVWRHGRLIHVVT